MSSGGDAAAAMGLPIAAALLPQQELPGAQFQPRSQLHAPPHVLNTDENALRLLVYSSLATATGGGTWAADWSAVAAAGGAAAPRAGASRNDVCRLGADGDSMIAVKIRPTGGVGSLFKKILASPPARGSLGWASPWLCLVSAPRRPFGEEQDGHLPRFIWADPLENLVSVHHPTPLRSSGQAFEIADTDIFGCT
jgi:hypothetical protein